MHIALSYSSNNNNNPVSLEEVPIPVGIEAVNPDQEEFFVGAAVQTTVVDELAPDLNATTVDYLATS